MKRLSNSILGFLVFMALSTVAFATDFSALKPPPGVKVTVVVFEDLECPSCAYAYPVFWEVAKAHNIPVEENEVLAGALSNVELGDEIPVELYKAVAEVLIFVLRLSGRIR